MSEGTTIYIGEGSPEYVAFRLLIEIAQSEDKKLSTLAGVHKVDRQWLLNTYAECLACVSGKRPPASKLNPYT